MHQPSFTILPALCALLMQAADRALEIADMLLREKCTCCTQDRMKLAARGYHLLMGGAFPAGNIMEACRVKWIVDRLDFKAHPFLSDIGVRPEGFRQGFTPLPPHLWAVTLVLSECSSHCMRHNGALIESCVMSLAGAAVKQMQQLNHFFQALNAHDVQSNPGEYGQHL